MTTPTIIGSQSGDVKLANDTTVLRKVGWRIVPLVLLMFLFSIIDRANVSFAALSMNRDLHIDPASLPDCFSSAISYSRSPRTSFSRHALAAQVCRARHRLGL